MKSIKILCFAIITCVILIGAGTKGVAASREKKAQIVSEERIIFTTSDMELVSVRPDGSDRRIIDSDTVVVSVSPDQRWVIGFSWTTWKTANIEGHIYDLTFGSKHDLHLPAGHWNVYDSWWSQDSRIFFSYSGITLYGTPILPPYSWSDRRNALIQKKLIYDLSGDSFDIEVYPTELQKTMEQYRISEYPEMKTEWSSANGAYKLKWELEQGPKRLRDILLKRLYLESVKLNKMHLIFEEESDKFGPRLELTDFPWSATEEKFVISYYRGGFWAGVLGADYDVTVYDAETMKKKRIGKGYHPFWIKSLPVTFN